MPKLTLKALKLQPASVKLAISNESQIPLAERPYDVPFPGSPHYFTAKRLMASVCLLTFREPTIHTIDHVTVYAKPLSVAN